MAIVWDDSIMPKSSDNQQPDTPDTPQQQGGGSLWDKALGFAHAAGQWFDAVGHDKQAADLTLQMDDVRQKIQQKQYADDNEYNNLRQQYMDLDQKLLAQRAYENLNTQDLKSGGHDVLAHATQLGGTIQGFEQQGASALAGAGIGAVAGSLIEPLGGTIAGAKLGTTIGNVVGGGMSGWNDNRSNAADAARQVRDDMEAKGMNVWLPENQQIIENTYHTALMEGLPYVLPDLVGSAYAGSKIIGSVGKGLAGALGKTALKDSLEAGGDKLASSKIGRLIQLTEKADLPEILGAKAAEKSGSPLVGRIANTLATGVAGTIGENWQELEQNRVGDLAQNEARKSYDPANYQDPNNFSFTGYNYFSPEGIETTKDVTATSLPLALLTGGLGSKGMLRSHNLDTKNNIKFGNDSYNYLFSGDKPHVNEEAWNTFKDKVATAYGIDDNHINDMSKKDILRLGYASEIDRTTYADKTKGKVSQEDMNNASVKAANDIIVELTGETKDQMNMGDRMTTSSTDFFNKYKYKADPNVVTPVNVEDTGITPEAQQKLNEQGVEVKQQPQQQTSSQQQTTEQTANTDTETNTEQTSSTPSSFEGTKWTNLGADPNLKDTVRFQNRETGQTVAIKSNEGQDGKGFKIMPESEDGKARVDTKVAENVDELNNIMTQFSGSKMSKQGEDTTETPSKPFTTRNTSNGTVGNSDATLVQTMKDFINYQKKYRGTSKGFTTNQFLEIARAMQRAGFTNKVGQHAIMLDLNNKAQAYDKKTGKVLGRVYGNTWTPDKKDVKDGLTHAVVSLYQGADLVTAVHEIAHIGWQNLTEQQRKEYAVYAQNTEAKLAATMLKQEDTPELRQQLRNIANFPELQKEIMKNGVLAQTIGMIQDNASPQVIALCVEERFAHEMSAWYVYSIGKGVAPNTRIQIIYNDACKSISKALGLLNATYNYVHNVDGERDRIHKGFGKDINPESAYQSVNIDNFKQAQQQAQEQTQQQPQQEQRASTPLDNLESPMPEEPVGTVNGKKVNVKKFGKQNITDKQPYFNPHMNLSDTAIQKMKDLKAKQEKQQTQKKGLAKDLTKLDEKTFNNLLKDYMFKDPKSKEYKAVMAEAERRGMLPKAKPTIEQKPVENNYKDDTIKKREETNKEEQSYVNHSIEQRRETTPITISKETSTTTTTQTNSQGNTGKESTNGEVRAESQGRPVARNFGRMDKGTSDRGLGLRHIGREGIIVKVSNKVQQILKKHNIKIQPVYNLSNNKKMFAECLRNFSVKMSNDPKYSSIYEHLDSKAYNGEYVYDYPKGTKLLVTEDGLCGCSISPEGEVGDLFNGQPHDINAVQTLFYYALDNGATNAMCAGRGRLRLYHSVGFDPIGKIKFNKNLIIDINQLVGNTSKNDEYILVLKDIPIDQLIEKIINKQIPRLTNKELNSLKDYSTYNDIPLIKDTITEDVNNVLVSRQDGQPKRTEEVKETPKQVSEEKKEQPVPVKEEPKTEPKQVMTKEEKALAQKVNRAQTEELNDLKENSKLATANYNEQVSYYTDKYQKLLKQRQAKQVLDEAKSAQKSYTKNYQAYQKEYKKLQSMKGTKDEEAWNNQSKKVQDALEKVREDKAIVEAASTVAKNSKKKPTTKAPTGTSRNQFAGEKAKTANLETLKEAKEMEKKGKDELTILSQTGWFRGVDTKWRFYIPDHFDNVDFSWYNPDKKYNFKKLSEVYDNPELYKAYKWLKDWTVEISSDGIEDSYGATNTTTKTIQINPNKMKLNTTKEDLLTMTEKEKDSIVQLTLFHEVQHAIQDKEGFAQGTDEDNINAKLFNKLSSLENKLAKDLGMTQEEAREYSRLAREWGATDKVVSTNKDMQREYENEIKKLNSLPKDKRDTVIQFVHKYKGLYEMNNSSANDQYSNTMGEIEARSTENIALTRKFGSLDEDSLVKKNVEQIAKVTGDKKIAQQAFTDVKKFVNKVNRFAKDNPILQFNDNAKTVAEKKANINLMKLEMQKMQIANKYGKSSPYVMDMINTLTSKTKAISNMFPYSVLQNDLSQVDNSAVLQKNRLTGISTRDEEHPTKRTLQLFTKGTSRNSTLGNEEKTEDKQKEKQRGSHNSYRDVELREVEFSARALKAPNSHEQTVNLARAQYYRDHSDEWQEQKYSDGAVSFTRKNPKDYQTKRLTYNGLNEKEIEEMTDLSPKGVYDRIERYALKKLVNDKSALARIARITGTWKAYQKIMVLKDQAQAAADAIENGIMMDNGKMSKGLSQIIADVGLNNQWDFINYCEALHVLDLQNHKKWTYNKETKKWTSKADPIEQKMSVAEAQQIINEVNASDHKQLFEENQQALTDYCNALLYQLVQGDIISQFDYENMKREYPHFIPLSKKFDIDDLEEAIHKGKLKQFININSPIHRIKSSTREIRNPFTVLQERTQDYYARASRNEAGLTFINEIAMAVTTTNDNKKVQMFGGLCKELAPDIGEVMMKGKMADENMIFFVLDKGRKKYYQIADRDAYFALKSFTPKQLSMFGKFLTIPKKILTITATAVPDFGIRNLLRDTIEATITSEHGFIPFLDAAWGWSQIWNNTEWWQEYQSLNGEFLSMNREGDNELVTPKQLKVFRQLLKVVSNPDLSVKSRATAMVEMGKIIPNKMLSPFKKFNDYMELGTRVAEYKNARMNYGGWIDRASKGGVFSTQNLEDVKDNAGMNDKYTAAYKAKEITLNFGQHGEWGEEINKFVPFFNAALQGAYKTLRVFKEMGTDQNGQRTNLIFKTMLIAFAAIAVAGAGQGDPDYEEAEDWEKQSFWILPHGYRFPKDQVLGKIIGNTVEMAADRIFKGKDIPVKDIFKNIANSLMPDNGLPEFLNLLLGTVGNYDTFRGTSVVPDYMAGLAGWEQKDINTSNIAKDLSKALFVATGGAWYGDWSAKKLDFALNQLFSNTAKYAISMDDLLRGNKVAKIGHGGEAGKYVDDVPFPVDKITGSFVNHNTSFKSITEFYDEYHRLHEIFGDSAPATTGKKKRESTKAKEPSGNPIIPVTEEDKKKWARYQVANKEMKKIRESLKEIKIDKTMTASEKRKAADPLFARELHLVKVAEGVK